MFALQAARARAHFSRRERRRVVDVDGSIRHLLNCTIDARPVFVAESAIPQVRLIDPAEVARTVGWLCLPGSGGITGQAIAIDGGEVAG